MATAVWTCSSCEFVNASSAKMCLVCTTPPSPPNDDTDNKAVYSINDECCKSLQECDHVQRTISMLQKFESIKSILQNENAKQNKSISECLFSSKIEDERINIMQDFVHIQQYHNKNDIDQQYYYNEIGDHCEQKNNKLCDKEVRHMNRYRDFSQYDRILNRINRNKNICNQYDNKDEIREMNLIQFLDKIHCSLLHQIFSNSTKFITNINISESDDMEIKDEENKKLPKYQFGEAFNVKPKHKNLKQEFLKNELYPLDIKHYQCLLEKANDFIQCYQRNFIFAKRESPYNTQIHCGDPMNIEHIMVVMSYCNIDDLQRSFKDGFRPKPDDKDEEDIKQRQCEIATWTRFLLETITLFGDVFEFGEKVYHGLSCKLQFDLMATTFSMPTSTTISLVVAQRFATNNGIILELTRNASNESSNLYLDVYSKYMFSDYPNEQERLIFGAGIGFSNIIYEDIHSEINHNEEIKSLYLYQQIIYGKYFSHRTDIFTDEYQKNIIKYIAAMMDKNGKNMLHYESNKNFEIDGYILYLFESMSINAKMFCFIKSEFQKLSNELQQLLLHDFTTYLRRHYLYNYWKQPPIYAKMIDMKVSMKKILVSSNISNGGHIKSSVCEYNINGFGGMVSIYFVIFKEYVQSENKTYFDSWITIEEVDKIGKLEVTALLWIEQIKFSGYLAGQITSTQRYCGGHMFELSKIENLNQLHIQVAIQDVKVIENADRYWINATEGKSEEPHQSNESLEQIRSWLTNDVGLPQYIDIFVENGFEELDVIKEMKINDLKEIGINNFDHRLILMQHITKLSENANHETDKYWTNVAEGTNVTKGYI